MVEKVLQLKCNCNNYPWGKKGSESIAATLCAKTPDTDFKVDEDKNYAEMYAILVIPIYQAYRLGGWAHTQNYPHSSYQLAKTCKT